jgi:hypothetical protein
MKVLLERPDFQEVHMILTRIFTEKDYKIIKPKNIETFCNVYIKMHDKFHEFCENINKLFHLS